MSTAPDDDVTVIRVDQFFPHSSAPAPQLQLLRRRRAAGLAYDVERMLRLRWADVDPANPANWTITWTVEHEGRGTRLFLVHEGSIRTTPRS
jgi:hypothetical protein